MDIKFVLHDQVFVWNDAKAASNVVKHQIEFREAAEVFFDPFVRGEDASDNGEKREAAIGYSEQQRLLTVVHLEADGDRIRIISAWRATAEERKHYEEAY